MPSSFRPVDHVFGEGLFNNNLAFLIILHELLKLQSNLARTFAPGQFRRPESHQDGFQGAHLTRNAIFDNLEELKRRGKTLLYTTHYMEEAERLCDRVAIVDHGKIIKTGTPRELKQSSAGTTRIEVRLARPATEAAMRALEGVSDFRLMGDVHVLYAARAPQAIVSLVKHLEADNNELQSMEMYSPSLEDVFIELTGRRLRE